MQLRTPLPGRSGAGPEVATHGAEVLVRGEFGAVLGPDPLDDEAMRTPAAGFRTGDDHDAVTLPDEDAARGPAVITLRHRRLDDPQLLAAVVGERVGVRVGLCPHKPFDVLGRPGPV